MEISDMKFPDWLFLAVITAITAEITAVITVITTAMYLAISLYYQKIVFFKFDHLQDHIPALRAK